MTLLFTALLLAQNYQPYPVAPRASGMGGAAAALGEGAGNTFYNPGAMAFGSTSNVEVSGTVFGLDLTTLKGELGDNLSRTRVGFAIIPSNLSLETHGLELGPIHLSDRWGLGVSVLAPVNVSLSSIVGSADQSTLVVREKTENIYTIYNDVGYRLTDDFGLGVSVVAVYRAYKASAFTDRNDGTSFDSLSYTREEQTIGHALSFGAQWKPQFGLRLGGSLRMPLQNVFGWGEEHLRFTSVDPVTKALTRVATDRRLDAKYERPWRFNLGVAWEVPERFAVAVELIGYTGRTYVSLRDAEGGETLAATRLAPVVNVAIGVELYVGKRAIRAGFFTDRSPYTDAHSDVTDFERIDRYGGTLSTTFQRGIFSTEIGLVFAAGKLSTQGYDVRGGAFDPVEASGLQWSALLTWSSSVRY